MSPFGMIKKINHIGIAVENLRESIALYSSLFGKGPDHEEEVVSEKVMTAFFGAGESNIELLQATSPDSPIAKFIEKRGKGGIHHVALEVDDLEEKLRQLKAAGITLIDEAPKAGAHGMKVAFVHPKGMQGVLIELVQK